jgi:hypothetical protein
MRGHSTAAYIPLALSQELLHENNDFQNEETSPARLYAG